MIETLTITTEQVDDIPLLFSHLGRMDLPSLIEQHFHQHGNWHGLSAGWTATIWLAHLLSQADHRLNQVQPWAENRLLALQTCTYQPVQFLDLTDDRLASTRGPKRNRRGTASHASTPSGTTMLIACARYLAAHAPIARAQGQTYRIAERLHRGDRRFEGD